jgi:hypothetical protein
MSIFYNISNFKHENFRHVLFLFTMSMITFIGLNIGMISGLDPKISNVIWQTLGIAPVIFGALTYIVLGVSLSYLSYQSLTRIVCFTAVVTDNNNRQYLNSFLFNLLLLNILATFMILGYVIMYFINVPPSIGHIIILAQSSLVVPISICMRILEGCIDKFVNLETNLESSCLIGYVQQHQKK